MSLTRRSIADQMDRLDEEISELQKDKAEIFAAYREQQEKDGVSKSQIKVELTALKVAIRHRRELSIDEQATSDRDALIDEIVTEIRNGLARDMQSRGAGAREDTNADGLDLPESLRR